MTLHLRDFQRILSKIKEAFKHHSDSDESSDSIESDEYAGDVLCPYCGSNSFEDVQSFYDENSYKIISRCFECGRYFISEYCLSDISGIDDYPEQKLPETRRGITRKGLIAS